MQYDPSPYEISLPKAVTIAGISVGFMALPSPLRIAVIHELQAAQRDTSVEYHRHDPESSIAKDLYEEVLILNSMIVACMRAANELENSNHHSGDEQKRCDTSSCILRSGETIP